MAPDIFFKLNLSFIRRIKYAEAHVSVKRNGERWDLVLILGLRWKDTLFMLCYITAMTFGGKKIIKNDNDDDDDDDDGDDDAETGDDNDNCSLKA